VSALAYAALIAYAMNSGAVISLGGGAAVGAIVGFLMWCSVDFGLYGMTNIADLTRTVVDPLLEIVHGATGGVAVAAVVKSMSPSVQPRAGGAARV
jgi:hypothetical protein